MIKLKKIKKICNKEQFKVLHIYKINIIKENKYGKYN